MIHLAIFGYGNIGHAAEAAVRRAPDMDLAGVFHHDEADRLIAARPDVVLLCTPTRDVREWAPIFLREGICTVDSFDIHGEIFDLTETLTPIARNGKSVAVVSAGWDPGSDSMVRTLMSALVPEGEGYTNFGPGRSMGHTVAAKAIPGVKDALSMTLPAGKGKHNRHVYIELQDGYDFEQVKAAILRDDYFAHDDTVIELVPSVEAVNTTNHGVHIERNGLSGETPDQQLDFTMRINNPALTGQMMTSCARAAYRMRQRAEWGCFTTIELRPIDLLPMNREEAIRGMV